MLGRLKRLLTSPPTELVNSETIGDAGIAYGLYNQRDKILYEIEPSQDIGDPKGQSRAWLESLAEDTHHYVFELTNEGEYTNFSFGVWEPTTSYRGLTTETQKTFDQHFPNAVISERPSPFLGIADSEVAMVREYELNRDDRYPILGVDGTTSDDVYRRILDKLSEGLDVDMMVQVVFHRAPQDWDEDLYVNLFNKEITFDDGNDFAARQSPSASDAILSKTSVDSGHEWLVTLRVVAYGEEGIRGKANEIMDTIDSRLQNRLVDDVTNQQPVSHELTGHERHEAIINTVRRYPSPEREMVLTTNELAELVHLPSTDLRESVNWNPLGDEGTLPPTIPDVEDPRYS